VRYSEKQRDEDGDNLVKNLEWSKNNEWNFQKGNRGFGEIKEMNIGEGAERWNFLGSLIVTLFSKVLPR
jgi:hypothetical protein